LQTNRLQSAASGYRFQASGKACKAVAMGGYASALPPNSM
jgi:hypothetical protein